MKRLILAIVLILLAGSAQATVTETTCTVTTTCNGSTTEFTFDFPIIDTTDLVVILRTVATGAETVLTETTDYTVSTTNNDYSSGGTVTTVSTYTSANSITILRNTPDTQQADLEDSKVLRLEDLEDAMDKLTMLVQQLQEELDRTLKIPRSDTSITTEVDDSVNRASKYLSFDSSGNVATSTSISSGSISVSAYMETVLDDADADAAKTTLTIPTISTFAETVLDDANAIDARTTLGAVGTSGADTITGAKTFSDAVTLSTASTFADGSVMASTAAPTTDAMVANKKYVDDSREPYARMYLTAAQDNLTDVTWATVTLDTDEFDFATITDTSNYKITPAVAGYYLCVGQVKYNNLVADKSYAAQLYFNGNTSKAVSYNCNGAYTTTMTVTVSDVILFDADDYIQLRVYVDTGANTVDLDPGTTDTFLVLYRL